MASDGPPLVPLAELECGPATFADFEAVKLLWGAVTAEPEKITLGINGEEDIRKWLHNERLYIARVPNTKWIVGTIGVVASSDPEVVARTLDQFELRSGKRAPTSVGAFRGDIGSISKGRKGTVDDGIQLLPNDYIFLVDMVYTHPKYRESGLSQHLHLAAGEKMAHLISHLETFPGCRIMMVFATEASEGGRRIQRRNFRSLWQLAEVFSNAVERWEGKVLLKLDFSLWDWYWEPNGPYEEVTVFSWDESGLVTAEEAARQRALEERRVGQSARL